MIFGLDIGGTLSKIVYLDNKPVESDLDFISSQGTVHFRIYPNSQLENLIEFMLSLNFSCPELNITGGGAYKYQSLLETSLNTRLKKIDEIESLLLGFKVITKESESKAFTFSSEGEKINTDIYPLPAILCNIGSGVSICKIDEKITRITGTCLGGGTALGLASILVGVKNYDELLELSLKGNADNADLLYSDIDSENGEDILAVSLGKLTLHPSEEFKREDIAKSIINMVAYNIGNVAYLSGKLESLNRIYFTGNFIRGYDYIMDRISFSVKYWSKNTAEAFFLKHDGYLGALGCLFSNSD